MKLGIFCNFGPPHCGGSEIVLENISRGLIDRYGYEITIYGYNYSRNFNYKGINIVQCKKGDEFIRQIAQNDHIFVYSDSFWGFDTLVRNIDKIDCGVSVALVGAYYMREHNKATGEKFKANIGRFRVICHSKGWDYQWCVENDIPYTIIPNGVNLAEFRENRIDFREKYNIKEKYVILNVSNYFYGKGQENLGKISKYLRKMRDDFIIVSISNSIKYPYDKVFLERAKKGFGKEKCLFLRDIPREDVIAAYKGSDVFLFSSRKEVAPLVLWEARAAKIPWVSLSVGDACSHHDGLCHVYCIKNKKGYIIFDDHEVSTLAQFTCRCMGEEKEPEYYDEVIQHDWDNIVPLYNEVFSK